MRRTLTIIICAVICAATVGFAGDGRIEISQSMIPYEITEPGSYLLTENLDSTAYSGSNAIQIATSSVTLDMNGFHVTGAAGADAVYAIRRENIEIRNGSIKDAGGNGIALSQCTNCVVVDVRVEGSGLIGIYIGDGTVRRCQVIRSGAQGIVLQTGNAIENTSRFNALDGLVINAGLAQNNVCTDNAGDGIDIGHGSVAGNTCISNSLNGIQIESGTARGNTSVGNGGDGIEGASCSAKDNICTDNGSSGIYVPASGTAEGNTCTRNGDYGIHLNTGSVLNNNCSTNGLDGVRVWQGLANGNTCFENVRHGVYLYYYGTAVENSCVRNGRDGIRVYQGSVVKGNSCFNNGYGLHSPYGAGILTEQTGCHIQGNALMGNDFGIRFLAASGNYYGNNMFRNNTTNIFGGASCVTGTYANVNVFP